ncbi:right-handed parallel beta-helix repeat-containing protein [Actinotalea sp. BY-33]|uniref:Right-handed parallel beta-helix repeat-containing protein n=1 Tax=Actinotalea soli TaxID=2819234 RepID=A0A939RWW0_9CELL|nr:right-handed parallel beta-helix repeat-containing protein [Actinotalea soli]MBO1752576.1 right-handed parallel beta-helix repeat-containing protein [Actinotalea soli]
MPTARTSRIRPLIAALATAALTTTGLGATAAAAAEHDEVTAPSEHVLNASQMDLGVYTTDTAVGRFVVTATETAAVEVDAQDRTGGGQSFTQRLKLNGAGTAERRSVLLTTQSEATVTVYALSASASADRALALYAMDGTELSRVPAYGAPTDIPVATLTVPEAGTYYVASPSSGVNIFALELAEGAAPERPAWATVADPVVTDVTVTGGDVVVAYDGVVGFEGADLATATLLDDQGEEVTSAISGTPGTSGSISLTPAATGDYEVQVALTRTGEEDALLSARVATPPFTLPLGAAEIHTALTSAVADGQATVTAEWTAVPEAEGYQLSHRELGATDWVPGPSTTTTRADIEGLVPGTTYELQVTTTRGDESTTSAPLEVTVADVVERWLTAHAGVSSGGTMTEDEDGSLHFDMRGNNGKIADSEDGFLYHYTQIDPGTENFTLSATFTVDDASGKDNQSGFGLIAVDTFIPNDRAARYFNSAGTMSAKYQRVVDGGLEYRYGIPGGKIVDGYTAAPTVSTQARDLNQSQPFDWDYRADLTEGSNLNPPKFLDGDVYEYTLRRSNTGYHSTWVHDGEVQEVIHYERDLVERQDPDALYVGVFAARGIAVTASDITFTTIHPDDDEEPLERPITYVTPSLVSDVTRTTPHTSIDVPLVTNVHGEAVLRDGDGEAVGTATLTPGERAVVTAPLQDGTNELVAELTPAPREEQTQLGEYEDLSSYETLTVPITVEVQRYGTPGQAIHVAPEGTADGDGTPDNPLDLHTGVAFAQPGQQVVLAGGTYLPERAVVIGRGNDGTADAPITLMSEPGSRATLDLSESVSGGIHLRGDHWHLHDLEITKGRGYQKPLLIQGNHNVVERIESHHNGDTGVQISGNATEPFEMWPSHNLVLSSVAHNNADPLANDADGFAAKLTVGDGNVFRYCIAFHNIDDGWDLYAKSTEGPIGAVVVEDSVTYRNGWLEADVERTTIGEGNGFKLGGENMPGQHVLRNSVAFDNYAKGITSNSGPDVRVQDVTAYLSGLVDASAAGNNLQLTTSAAVTHYRATGVLSYVAQQADQIGLRDQEDVIRTDPSNYLTVAGGGVRDASRNSEGVHVQDEWFTSLDTDLRPSIAADGSVEMHGLLELTDQAPADTGARLEANPDPTEIILLPPVSGETEEPEEPGTPRPCVGPPPHAGTPGPPPHAGKPGPPPHAGKPGPGRCAGPPGLRPH